MNRNRLPGLLLIPALAFMVVGSPAFAQRPERSEDLGTLLARARQVVGSCNDGEARDLLRNAEVHGDNARRLDNHGRPVFAAREARLARRLAERAIERCRGGQGGERKEDLERMLRRNDRRLGEARAWLRSQRRPDPSRSEDLATASRQMDRAWEAFRAGQNSESLKHLATVRQILGTFPEFRNPEDNALGQIASQVALTDRLIAAMGKRLPDGSGLGVARDANDRARNLLEASKPGQASARAAEARGLAIKAWNDSGLAADREVTGAMLDANSTSIEDLAAYLERNPSESAASLEEARRRNDDAKTALSRGRVDDAWSLALETSRLLADLRVDLLEEYRDGR